MPLTYGDFFVVALIPIILQSLAAVYLWKIHRIIGCQMTYLLGGINLTLILYDITVAYLIVARGEETGRQAVTWWGLFIGFIMPLVNAILHFILQRKLAKSLLIG